MKFKYSIKNVCSLMFKSLLLPKNKRYCSFPFNNYCTNRINKLDAKNSFNKPLTFTFVGGSLSNSWKDFYCHATRDPYIYIVIASFTREQKEETLRFLELLRRLFKHLSKSLWFSLNFSITISWRGSWKKKPRVRRLMMKA